MPANLLSSLGQALLGLALQIALIVLLASLLMRGGHMLARRTVTRLEHAGVDPGRRARVETLLRTAVGAADVIVIIIAALMVLHALGINITPLLAGVSVAGLAVSLGAQALIRDFIGGFLILFEDQFHAGDVIQIGDTSGTVEEITLRTTRLRDDQGKLWIVPNGDIRIVSNYTRDWARAVVDINIAAGEDPAPTIAALSKAMAELQDDPAVRDSLLAPPEVHNWNSLSDTSVQVRLTAKTVAGKQWEVARALREYAAAALRAAGKNGDTVAAAPQEPPGASA